MCGYVCFLFIRSQKNILTMAIKLIPSISMYVLGQMSNSCFWFLEKPFFINAPSINIQLKNIRRSNMHRSFFSVTSIERKLILRNILNSNQKKLIRYSKYSYVNFVGNQLCHPVPHLVDSFLMHVRPFLYLLVVVLQNQQHKLNCLENSIPAAWNKFRCMGKKLLYSPATLAFVFVTLSIFDIFDALNGVIWHRSSLVLRFRFLVFIARHSLLLLK